MRYLAENIVNWELFLLRRCLLSSSEIPQYALYMYEVHMHFRQCNLFLTSLHQYSTSVHMFICSLARKHLTRVIDGFQNTTLYSPRIPGRRRIGPSMPPFTSICLQLFAIRTTFFKNGPFALHPTSDAS